MHLLSMTSAQPFIRCYGTKMEPIPSHTVANARRAKRSFCKFRFAGVHSNVGGGYPDDSLANVSLSWMLAEAEQAGLSFKKMPSADPDALLSSDSAKDKDGRLYDPGAGSVAITATVPEKFGISTTRCRAKMTRKANRFRARCQRSTRVSLAAYRSAPDLYARSDYPQIMRLCSQAM